MSMVLRYGSFVSIIYGLSRLLKYQSAQHFPLVDGLLICVAVPADCLMCPTGVLFK